MWAEAHKWFGRISCREQQYGTSTALGHWAEAHLRCEVMPGWASPQWQISNENREHRGERRQIEKEGGREGKEGEALQAGTHTHTHTYTHTHIHTYTHTHTHTHTRSEIRHPRSEACHSCNLRFFSRGYGGRRSSSTDNTQHPVLLLAGGTSISVNTECWVVMSSAINLSHDRTSSGWPWKCSNKSRVSRSPCQANSQAEKNMCMTPLGIFRKKNNHVETYTCTNAHARRAHARTGRH